MTFEEKKRLVHGMHKNASIYVGIFATLDKQYNHYHDANIILNENHTRYRNGTKAFLDLAKKLLCEIETAANSTQTNFTHVPIHEMKMHVHRTLKDYNRITPDFERDIINAAKKFSHFAKTIARHIEHSNRKPLKPKNNGKNKKPNLAKKRKQKTTTPNPNNTIESGAGAVVPKRKINKRRNRKLRTTLPPQIVDHSQPINSTVAGDETMPTTLRPIRHKHNNRMNGGRRTTRSFQ